MFVFAVRASNSSHLLFTCFRSSSLWSRSWFLVFVSFSRSLAMASNLKFWGDSGPVNKGTEPASNQGSELGFGIARLFFGSKVGFVNSQVGMRCALKFLSYISFSHLFGGALGSEHLASHLLV